jgi:DNA polymerase-1
MSNTDSAGPKVLLLDAFGLIFRSYHAFVDRPILNAEGKNINALFGFFKTLFQLVREQKPTHLVVMYDSKTPTFRDELFAQYKAQRDAAPDDLIAVLPEIEQILDALGVPVMQRDGFEADDLIATGARWCRENGVECLIVSNDKDLLQMVGGPVKALRSGFKGGWSVVGPEEVFESRGVHPGQIADWLALVGDTADNIPGVKGIGDKTAIQLLSEFGSLDGIYANLDKVTKAAARKNLEEGRAMATLSKSLTILRDDLDLGFSLEAAALKWKPGREAADLFLKQNAKTLAAEALTVTGAVVKPVHVPGQAAEAAPEPERQHGPAVLTGDYETVTTFERLDAWIAKLRASGTGAVDLETDTLDTFAARLVGLSLSCEEGIAAYIPLICAESGSLEAPELLDTKAVLARLKPLFEDPAFSIVGQNFKFDFKVLRRHGITVPRFGFDTMIAAWLLDAGAGVYGLETLGINYLGLKGVAFGDLVAKGKNFGDVPLAEASRYAAEDADLTWRLFQLFVPKLEKAGLTSLLHDLELPLAHLLARMEDEGITLRSGELQRFGQELALRIADLEQEIFALCGGKTFNLGSPKQLQEILFVDRQLVPPPRAKIKTGYSTDSDILEELAEQDPVPAKILAWRTLSKLKSTYVETLPLLVNKVTGRLHTQYIQTGTATGRLASKDPNLQNIPIREDDGRRIRQAFVPREGWTFVSADYSQIELVVLAHLCQDKNLVSAFLEGKDIHRQTASLMFAVPLDMVTSDMRRAAKTINFGLMYGMSAFRLANELKISRKEAQSFFDAYKREFSGVDLYFQSVIAEAEKTGDVGTMLGHRRTLPNITGRNRVEKQAAERVAMNTPIQGSAADIVKTAMLRVDRALREGGFQARLLLQVHDELLLEVPPSEVETIKELLRREMEGAFTLSVPLRVGIEAGATWGELH